MAASILEENIICIPKIAQPSKNVALNHATTDADCDWEFDAVDAFSTSGGRQPALPHIRSPSHSQSVFIENMREYIENVFHSRDLAAAGKQMLKFYRHDSADVDLKQHHGDTAKLN